MIKYYCDICGNEALKHEYNLPLNPTTYEIFDHARQAPLYFEDADDFAQYKIHLCMHCALRIKNFIESQMIPNDKTYDDFLWSIQ